MTMIEIDSTAGGEAMAMAREATVPEINVHDVLKRIDRRLLKTHLTQRAAALAADLSPDFIRSARRQAASGKQSKMRPHNLALLAVPLQCNADWLMYGTGPEEIADTDTAMPTAEARQRARLANVTPALPIRGAVVADGWFGPDYTGVEAVGMTPPPPHPAYPAKAQYALVVRDGSVNRHAVVGDYVIVLDRKETTLAAPRAGALVVVSRHRDSLRETTVQRIGADGRTLQFESSETRFTRRSREQALHTDDRDVAIEGLVVATFRTLD